MLRDLDRQAQRRPAEHARGEGIEELPARVAVRLRRVAEAEAGGDELDVRARPRERRGELVVVRRREGRRIGEQDAHGLVRYAVAMLVRTWNLFHGKPSPPGRRAFLRQMIELVTRDRPDVVCLQELPVWALRHLESWSGMHAATAVARRPLLPVGARTVTALHHGLLRSAFTGEGDAILTRDRRARPRRARRRPDEAAPHRPRRRARGRDRRQLPHRRRPRAVRPRDRARAGSARSSPATRTSSRPSPDGFSPPLAGQHRPDPRPRPRAARRPVRVAARAAHRRRPGALGSRAGRGGRRVTLEEARAQFPVLERYAYLNAGLERAAPAGDGRRDAGTARARSDARAGAARRTSRRCFELRESASAAASPPSSGPPPSSSRSPTRRRAAARSSSPGSASARTTR